MRAFRLFIAAATCAAMLGISAVPVLAGVGTAVIYVDDDGLGTATSCDGEDPIHDGINEALSEVAEGGKVLVCPGTYEETIDIETAGVTLRGVTPWTARVVGPEGATDGTDLVTIRQPDVTVKWLRLIAPTAGTEDCELGDMIEVREDATNVRIRANHIETQGADTLGPCGYETGIRIEAPRSTVVWNRVTNFKGVGINLPNAHGAVVRGNTIRYIHPGTSGVNPGLGIHINNMNASTLIAGNVVVSGPNAKLGTGINIINSAHGRVRGNRVRNANDGIVIDTADGLKVYNNRVPKASNDALTLQSVKNSEIHNNRMSGNHLSAVACCASGQNNSIHDNDFSGPADPDCIDFTFSNAWIDNTGQECNTV